MPRVAVLGGGIAGLAAAIGLSRAGWAASVHERATALEPLGAALSLWDNAAAALESLGVLRPVASAGMPIRSMLVADDRGRPILGPRAVLGRAVLVTRAALQSALADALGPVRLELGRTVEAVAQGPDGAAVRFADGRSVEADLVVDALGIWSPLAPLRGGGEARFAGYGGVLALSDPVADAAASGAAREYWGRGERFGVLELRGRRRYWFHMRDQREDAPAPTLAAVAERARGWPTPMAETIAATPAERLIPFAIHAKPPPTSLGRGRIIAVGDAAHAMEPNLGQGACQALEDGAALHSIGRHAPPERMLAAFEAARLKRVRAIVRQAAQGRWGAHGPRAGQAVTRALLRGAPDRLNDRVIGSVQTMPDYG